MLTHEIKEILSSEAKTFYTRFKRDCGGVSFLDKGKFYGLYEAKRLQGIISVMNVGKSIRIKTFMVRPSAQGRGVGGYLLDFILYKGLSTQRFARTSQRAFLNREALSLTGNQGALRAT